MGRRRAGGHPASWAFLRIACCVSRVSRSCPPQGERRARRTASLISPKRDEPLCASLEPSRPRPGHLGSVEVRDDALALPRVTRAVPEARLPSSAPPAADLRACDTATPTRMTQKGRLRLVVRRAVRGARRRNPTFRRFLAPLDLPARSSLLQPPRLEPRALPRLFFAPLAVDLAQLDARDLPCSRRARGPDGHRPRRLLVHRRVRPADPAPRALEVEELTSLVPLPHSLQIPLRVRPF